MFSADVPRKRRKGASVAAIFPDYLAGQEHEKMAY